MAVNLSPTGCVRHSEQPDPANENDRPAQGWGADLCSVGAVALAVLLTVGCVAGGIALIALGAVTANPPLLELGIYLLALPIIILLGGSGYRYRY